MKLIWIAIIMVALSVPMASAQSNNAGAKPNENASQNAKEGKKDKPAKKVKKAPTRRELEDEDSVLEPLLAACLKKKRGDSKRSKDCTSIELEAALWVLSHHEEIPDSEIEAAFNQCATIWPWGESMQRSCVWPKLAAMRLRWLQEN